MSNNTRFCDNCGHPLVEVQLFTSFERECHNGRCYKSVNPTKPEACDHRLWNYELNNCYTCGIDGMDLINEMQGGPKPPKTPKSGWQQMLDWRNKEPKDDEVSCLAKWAAKKINEEQKDESYWDAVAQAFKLEHSGDN